MNYNFYHKTILRTPLKPLKTNFNAEELCVLFTQKEVQEALFLSSPNLLNEFIKWQNGEITDKTEVEKLIYSLLKYALRMHNRCTPYGLFAGCGVIENSNHNNIIISKKSYQRSTRLDMNFTCALAQELAKKPFIQSHLKFYPNTSIYNLHDKIRYVEYFYKDKRRIHQINAVDNTIYLQKIIQKAKQGVTIRQLSELLVCEEINYEEAEYFINDVIDSQLLICELEPSVTGEELLSQILTILNKIKKENQNLELLKIINILDNVQKEIQKIDKKIGNNITEYESLSEKLKKLDIPLDVNKLFQTDLYISPNISNNQDDNINRESIYEKMLVKALKILNKLSHFKENPNLKTFKEKIYQRYEEDEVSLSKLLDTESGIGYNNNNQTGDVNPLIENLLLNEVDSDSVELALNKKQSFLFKRLIKANQDKEYSITINSKDVEKFEENWNNYPDSIAIMYTHVGNNNGLPLLTFKNAGGSSAISLLGRFGAGNKEIEEIVKEVALHEQNLNTDKIIASILHLPESRTGNILLRPIVREYEIPYLSKSTLPRKQQILLDDLFVSIRNNKIILRSKRLNKEIITRLDNAHNYSFNALPIYYFLCDMQTQNIQEDTYFDWGNLKNNFSFLPRVEIEGVIVSLATWQLKKDKFKLLLEKNNLIKNALEWQEKWQLPDLVLLADGDNELLINLKDELSLSMFIAEINKRDAIVLKEFLFDEKTALVKDGKGNVYTNEFITILQKQLLEYPTLEEDKLPVLTKNKIERTFSIGSEWLYYKIYCGVKIADKILTEVIKPLTEQLIKNKLIDNWFFIRYADPDVHLRLRFHLSDTSKIGEVVSLFYKAANEYQTSGLIWKIQTDTYQREIERYGVATMILSEQLFYYDSKYTIKFLDQIKGSEGEELRWLFGIKTIDELLNLFQYKTEDKLILLEHLKTGFALEFNMNKNLKMQLDKKYRDKRNSIETFLWDDEQLNKKYQFITILLKVNNKNITPIAHEILSMQQNNSLELPLNDLLASYIHMFLNRLFKNKQRLHEMIIYDFMWRSYRSELAKKLPYKESEEQPNSNQKN